MTDHYFYRFRPLDRALGGELENQQIYFAKPEQLNDPAEGFRDIIWKGDAVLLENLFRHYIQCEKHKRQELKFYQAYYSWRSGTIEAAELSSIRFKPKEP